MTQIISYYQVYVKYLANKIKGFESHNSLNTSVKRMQQMKGHNCILSILGRTKKADNGA